MVEISSMERDFQKAILRFCLESVFENGFKKQLLKIIIENCFKTASPNNPLLNIQINYLYLLLCKMQLIHEKRNKQW